MRVYGGSTGERVGERERERERGAQKEEEEEIIWLVPAATLIPCPVIFYARWLDRGLVGIRACDDCTALLSADVGRVRKNSNIYSK